MASTWQKIILLLLGLSVLLNVWLYQARTQEADRNGFKESSQNFTLLYPPFSYLSYEEFIDIKHQYATNYQDLKQTINNSIHLAPDQDYAFYFQSLNSGASIGLREKETFYSGSLRKVPLLVAILQQVEEGELDFDTIITIEPEDINSYSGPLGSQGSGQVLTLFELMNYTTFYSDNTAAEVLLRIVSPKEVIETMFNMGLSYNTFLINRNSVGTYPLSVKEFSNSFRSLYYSSVLKRKNSQLLLSLLAHTSFNSGLPAGVPPEIIVAHKVASFGENSEHHDCGIIYYPEQPYILCVMTKGMSEEDANKVIRQISKETYDYISFLNGEGTN
ncbi:serine hydrolase [Candidatus Woesearchaeota archaeon]|nr:serine hydrolase [Candidatus Woesearchaeota archaeon]